MTREEAVKHLSEWMDEKMWRCFGTIDREAIGMAIEALQAEETMVIQTGQTHGKSAYIKELAEVVRCKDCRWYEQKQKNLPYNVSKRYCNRSCVLATKENDFCSYGERKDNG